MAYSGTPTTYGEQKIAAALAGGQPLTVVAIAVGDGGGSPVSPSEGQTSLTHEVWRGAITSWGVDPADTRRIVVHVTVPATAGPFVVREAGVYDGSGGLICVTALAATEVVGPGSSNQATSIDLIIAMPIGSAGAITVSPTQGERFTIERLYRTPFISINSASTTAPPASPALGDLYIVPTGATGAWATAGAGTLAEWNGTFWAFLAPPLKMVAGIMDAADDAAAEYLKWDGTAWEAFAAPGVIFTVTDTAGASTPDELIGTASPGLTALQPNMIFRWRQGATANATTSSKGNVNQFGDKPFTKADSSPLAKGDLPANADFLTEYDGTRFRVLGQRLSDVQAATLFYGPDTSTTANTVTVAIPAFSAGPTVGRPFEVKIANTLTGASKINVNGAGLVMITRGDGSPTQAGDLVVGQDAQFVFDGTNVQVQGLLSSALPARNRYTFRSRGTYTFTVPAGVTKIFIRIWGGGGGGGGSSGASYAGGGAAAGGYDEGWFNVTPGQVITVIVAAGGAAGNGNTPTNGGNGGTSSVGSLISATGGQPGQSNNGVGGVNGGLGVGGVVNFQGGGGGPGGYVGTSTANVYSGFGAPSYGQSLIPSSFTAGTVNAFGPGSGGAGGCGGSPGGTGADGYVDIQC